MSHLVVHDDHNGVTHYAPFDDLRNAAAYLEELHNSGSAVDARLYSLEEVHFEVRSYVKVEIGEPSVPPAGVADEPVAPRAVSDDVAEDDATVEYVEAAMVPVGSYPPVPEMPEMIDEPSSGEVRRGLFGR